MIIDDDVYFYRVLELIRSEIIYNGTTEKIVAGSYMTFLRYQTRTIRSDMDT
jgi:hypothetical protein